MARPEQLALEVLQTPGAGHAEHVFRLRDKTVQVFGTFTGTLQLEGAIADGEYAPIGAPVTAPGLLLVPETVVYLRVRTVDLSAGAAGAIVAGFDERAW